MDSVEALMTRWSNRYYISADGVVTRNPNCTFEFSTPPVIQSKDKRAIVLMASIILKSGKKNTQSSSTASWKDDEVSYSNIEGSKQLSSSLTEDINELNRMLPIKLAQAKVHRNYGWVQDFDR
jgi:hypothetical protein